MKNHVSHQHSVRPLLALPILFASLMLAGCGGGSGGGTNASASSTSTTSASAGAGNTVAPVTPVVTNPGPVAPVQGPAPVAGNAVTYYFSDCQAGASAGCVPGNNANVGTSANAPKQNLTGFNVNTLPAGSTLLFARGGAWNHATIRVDNRNVSAAAPLTFDAYGSGAVPLFKVVTPQSNGFEFGAWQNTEPDGGYVFRNLKLDGSAGADSAFWLVGRVSDVLIDNVEIRGFTIGVNAQVGDPISKVTVRNSHIVRNTNWGFLGNFNESLLENNLIEENNPSGSIYNHGMYLSNSTGTTVRGNQFVRNSVVNGQCTGGNLTVHGVVDRLTIEGNTITQTNSADSCFGIQVVSGYATAEGFRNSIIRGNTVTNLGGCAICVNAAPGILIENNKIVQGLNRWHFGVYVRANTKAIDLAGGGELVRNNIACLPFPSQVGVKIETNGTAVDNVVRLGADATTGVCAP